jgi:hypothetical protein
MTVHPRACGEHSFRADIPSFHRVAAPSLSSGFEKILLTCWRPSTPIRDQLADVEIGASH